jgi:F-type H+-transporting ATPase subunit a
LFGFLIESPLEQFRILAILPMSLGSLDISVTNSSVILFVGVSAIVFLLKVLFPLGTERLEGDSVGLLPTSRWGVAVESVMVAIMTLLEDNLGKKANSYLPFVVAVFLFVIQSNLIGLVPYSFTVTSHLIVTFGLALTIFVGVNIIGGQYHKINLLSLFLPQGTSLPLALLLVPIELVSYIFKPVSLAVRLFANMMAGHTLLKVIAGFAWSMMKNGLFLLIAHFIPLLVLVLLIGLELGVALIQAYVFTILTCIYLNDSINLH